MVSKDVKLTPRTTFLSAGAVVILLGGVISAAVTITSISGMAAANHERIKVIEQRSLTTEKTVADQLKEINESVNIIKGYLEAKKNQK